MADEFQDNMWPLPAVYFSVKLAEGVSARFQEVSDLETDAAPFDRQGPVVPPKRMPALSSSSEVTLRKGPFVNDQNFRTWHNEIKSNTIKPGPVVITLLDESGAAKMTWTLNNARPVKIDAMPPGDEVAVGALEIVYETLTVTEL